MFDSMTFEEALSFICSLTNENKKRELLYKLADSYDVETRRGEIIVNLYSLS